MGVWSGVLRAVCGANEVELLWSLSQFCFVDLGSFGSYKQERITVFIQMLKDCLVYLFITLPFSLKCGWVEKICSEPH